MASGTIAERNASARKVSAKAAKAPPESAQAASVRQLLSALKAFRRGDFSVRLPHDMAGVEGELADVFNEVVELNDRMTREFERLGEVVGKQGKINHRAKLPGANPGIAAKPGSSGVPASNITRGASTPPVRVISVARPTPACGRNTTAMRPPSASWFSISGGIWPTAPANRMTL